MCAINVCVFGHLSLSSCGQSSMCAFSNIHTSSVCVCAQSLSQADRLTLGMSVWACVCVCVCVRTYASVIVRTQCHLKPVQYITR